MPFSRAASRNCCGRQFLRPPPSAAGLMAELRAIDAAGDGEIGMGVHVIDAPRLIDAIDDADMGIGVIDHRAGMDAAGLKRGRIEIRRNTAVHGGIGAIGAGIDIVQHGADGGGPVDAAAMVDHAGAADDAVGSVRRSANRPRHRHRKRAARSSRHNRRAADRAAWRSPHRYRESGRRCRARDWRDRAGSFPRRSSRNRPAR